MKASSRRAAALLWNRLQPHCAPKVGSSKDLVSMHLRPVTTDAQSRLPGVSKRTVPKSPFSTAVLEELEEEYSEATEIVVAQRQAYDSLNDGNGPPPCRDATAGRQPAVLPSGRVLKCTCGYQDQKAAQEPKQEPSPPPLPVPVYSVHKRVLPNTLTALSSPPGRQYLQECMASQMAESYWALTEQFVNQSDPAYCGVTTLLMVLNAMNVDPNSRWKGGWRYYGDEDVILQRCCLDTEQIRRIGITMEQFRILGTCHGLRITMKRPGVNDEDSAAESTLQYSLDDFRSDIRQILDSRINKENAMLVASFSRTALHQTGDGHFSPLAAYHEESDKVLVLDVARFKYAPYWVSVDELYRSLLDVDEATQRPRGWFIMRPPEGQQNSNYHEMTTEDRRPAHLVPDSHEGEACPVGKIKIEFCSAKNDRTKASKPPPAQESHD